MQRFDAIVLGGGAAGLMCAIEAGKRGRRVAVLEHADRCGKKILISGGGRCNFTNLIAGRKTSSPPIRTSPNRRWPVTPRQTSSRWWRNIASPITKKLSASFSATALRARFCTCWKQNARPPESEIFVNTEVVRGHRRHAISCCEPHRRNSARPSWSSRPAASPFRRWARPALATIWRDNSD